MGDENIRKHDPAENRENRMGYPEDSAKTGGAERNVGLTNAAVGGTGAGSGGAIGGSGSFVSGETRDHPQTIENEPATGDDTKQVLTGDQEGDDNFGGRTGSGSSAIAANSSRDDLGAAGAGQPQAEEEEQQG